MWRLPTIRWIPDPSTKQKKNNLTVWILYYTNTSYMKILIPLGCYETPLNNGSHPDEVHKCSVQQKVSVQKQDGFVKIDWTDCWFIDKQTSMREQVLVEVPHRRTYGIFGENCDQNLITTILFILVTVNIICHLMMVNILIFTVTHKKQDILIRRRYRNI